MATATHTLPPFNVKSSMTNVFSALMKAKRRYGKNREILVDGDERVLTYDAITKAAFALGHALKKGTKKGESVGILLPTGAGAVIAFFAVHAYGRIPAMLNFTSGARSLQAACRAGEIKRIITAHKFVELGKLDGLIEEMKGSAEIVYLEDVRENLGLLSKLHAAVGSIAPWLVQSHPKPDDTCVILFTSGTEGDPKGVVLSHQNIVANVEQVRSHIELTTDDIIFNPLPTFHCFGLTVGALMPLYLGIKEVLHPSPLQPREIAKRVRSSGATILLATDTFINQYARAGDQGDLNSLRLAVCGAERVRDETRQLMRRKYNMEILEGYGVTETAPVIAANQIGGNRPGTVGRLLPGMESRLDPVEGVPNAGRLFVRGPNVMKGYIKPDAPMVVMPPTDGWHDTGDVVSIDDDGYIAIRGRLKRFAKIGGEMVSLAVVENCASALWPDNHHAAVAIADDRKGEQIVLVTDSPAANRLDLVGWAQNHGVPELAVPRKIVLVDNVPVLGTGKTDYNRVQKMAEERAQSAAA